MITVSFEKRGALGLCDFLYQEIKKQVLEGTLASHEKLPSKRSLSQNLGISVITVQNAYARLISEGYIYSVEKRGFFVADLLPVKNTQPVQKKNHGAKKISMDASEEKRTSYMADFSSNAVAYQKFPFSQWSHVLRAVLNSGDEKLLSRSNAHGVLELRLSIARYLKEFRGMDVLPEQIVVGSGTENLYAMLVQLLGRQRKFAVENPGYKKIASIIKLNGAECIPLQIDFQGMNPLMLKESGSDVVHISPAHHFPTGIVMPVRRRQEILEWAKKRSGKKRIIIEDDYDSEFRFNGNPLPTLQSEDTSGSVIYVNTFSKTLSPSFRIGYMVLPQKLIPLFEKTFSHCSCPVTSVEQYALSRFIDQGHYGSHIIRMKNYYRNLRNEIIRTIQKSSLSKIFTIHEEEAGLHFLLTLSTDEYGTAGEIAERLRTKGKVNLPLLKEYFYGHVPAFYKNTFVMNYSGIGKDEVVKIARAMEAAVFSLE